MTAEEIRELGRLAGALEGMQHSLDEKHQENQRGIAGLAAQIAAHDHKDQAAFAEIFRRLSPLENRTAAEIALDAKEAGEINRAHAWRIAQITALAIIAAAALGAFITWFLMRGHP